MSLPHTKQSTNKYSVDENIEQPKDLYQSNDRQKIIKIIMSYITKVKYNTKNSVGIYIHSKSDKDILLIFFQDSKLYGIHSSHTLMQEIEEMIVDKIPNNTFKLHYLASTWSSGDSDMKSAAKVVSEGGILYANGEPGYFTMSLIADYEEGSNVTDS